MTIWEKIKFEYVLTKVEIRTYICNECLGMFSEVEPAISFPINNLKHDHSKAENIRFYRKQTLHCILRSHVAADQV